MVASPSAMTLDERIASMPPARSLPAVLLPALAALAIVVAVPSAPAWAPKSADARRAAGGARHSKIERHGTGGDGVPLEISVEDWGATTPDTGRVAAALAVAARGLGV